MGWFFKGPYDPNKIEGFAWHCDCGDWEDGFKTEGRRDRSQDRHVSTAHAGEGWNSRRPDGSVRFYTPPDKHTTLLKIKR